MRTLPERSFRVLRELARTLFDTGAGVPEPRLDWVVAELRDMLAYTGALARFGLRMAVAFLQFAPILLFGRLRRFTSLRTAERTRMMRWLEEGPFAIAFVPVKLYLCMVYFEHPDAARETGWDGYPLVRPPGGLAA